MAKQLVTIDLLTESGKQILTEDRTRHLIIHTKWIDVDVSVGGGPYVANGFYIPMTKQLTHTTKMVLVTVSIGGNDWKKAYVVDRIKAKIIVRVIDIINNTKSKFDVGVAAIRRTTKRVLANFSSSKGQ